MDILKAKNLDSISIGMSYERRRGEFRVWDKKGNAYRINIDDIEKVLKQSDISFDVEQKRVHKHLIARS